MPRIPTSGASAVRLMEPDVNRPPSQQFFPSITIEPDSANTGKLLIGWPPPNGKGGAVTTSVHDAFVDTKRVSASLDGNPGTLIDATKVWIIPEVSGESGDWYGGVAP